MANFPIVRIYDEEGLDPVLKAEYVKIRWVWPK